MQLSEINNTLEGINSRLDEAEDQISDLEEKVENTHPGRAAKRKKNLKNEYCLRTILDSTKYNNTRIVRIPEGEDSEQGIENLFEEIMIKNFPNLLKEKGIQVQEAQSPQQVGPKEAYTQTHHN